MSSSQRRRRIVIAGAAAALVVAAVAAVAATRLRSRSEPDRYGWYRAVLEIGRPGEASVELPFFLYLPENGEQGRLLNDREEVPLEHRWQGDRVSITLAHYTWQIEATATGEGGGSLAGRLTATHPIYRQDLLPGETQLTIELHGRRVPRADPEARFQLPGGDEPAADFSGSWRVEPEEPVDESGGNTALLYKAVFEQQGSRARGDVILDTGDLRFMGGNVRGKSIAVAALDGSHFALLRATMERPGRMTGELFLLRRRTRFVADRTEIAGSDIQRRLAGVDLTGWRPAALERYRGKPIIVEVFGTWCSNCNDSIALLRELYDRHHPQGLEIVGFSVEMTEDKALADGFLKRFVERHKIPWQVATVTDEDELEALMKPFQGAYAVPLLLFLRRDGTVAGVRTGYIGPNAPADHRAMRTELERLADEITASR